MARLSAASSLAAVWIRLSLFVAPILLIVCLPVYLIDPYGLFAKRSVVDDAVRYGNAARVNHVLLGIIAYTRHPVPNILLGDSQMNHFKSGEIAAITGRPYSNLSYGGGTLAESIATFWYATRTGKLARVYFGLSFYSFTDNTRNRVGEAIHIVSDPLAYFTSGDVWEAAWDDLSAQFFHRAVSYQPTVDAAAFWRRQLAELERRKQTYSASDRTLAELREIVRYCQTHGIQIVFVIPPEHRDARARMEDLGMHDEYIAFKSVVAALGPSFDCDIDNAFTRDAANFEDPYHTNPAAAWQITESIWSNRQNWCDRKGAE
jgi:hypothetical protein